MSETLLWVQVVLSSSTLITLGGGLIYFGRLLQKVDDHDRRLLKIEERLDGAPIAMGLSR